MFLDVEDYEETFSVPIEHKHIWQMCVYARSKYIHTNTRVSQIFYALVRVSLKLVYHVTEAV